MGGSPSDYLQLILNARVYDVAIESPLDLSKKLSIRINNQVWLKREETQPIFSFKNSRRVQQDGRHLAPEELSLGVVCASAGNHGQGSRK